VFVSCNETAENHFPVCSSGTEIGTQTENSAPSGTRTRPAPDRRVPAHPGAPRRVPARGGRGGGRSHGAAPGAPPALTISRLCLGKQRVVRKLLTGGGGAVGSSQPCSAVLAALPFLITDRRAPGGHTSPTARRTFQRGMPPQRAHSPAARVGSQPRAWGGGSSAAQSRTLRGAQHSPGQPEAGSGGWRGAG